jgi:hypothetical protein
MSREQVNEKRNQERRRGEEKRREFSKSWQTLVDFPLRVD